jgi:hypothetical protein
MAGIKKTKATRAQKTDKKSAPASNGLKKKAPSTMDMSAALVASPTTTSTPSRFFTLPPELRNKIYRYALVRDEPIKVHFEVNQRGRRGRRCRFTMLPALATVSKQVRLESQRIFFEENQFEITPKMLKPRSFAALIAFKTICQRLRVEIRALRICQEIKKRCDGDLFQLRGCFTVSKAGPTLSISNELYSATPIGRASHANPHIFVCGCDVRRAANNPNKRYQAGDIGHFLIALMDDSDAGARSCHYVDVAQDDEVVQRGWGCNDCQRSNLSGWKERICKVGIPSENSACARCKGRQQGTRANVNSFSCSARGNP